MCCAHTPLWDGTLLFQPSLGFSRHTRIQPTHMVSIIWPGFCLLSNLDLISALFQSLHLVCICKIGLCHHTWFQPFDIFDSEMVSIITRFQLLHLASTIAPSLTSQICFHSKTGHQWVNGTRLSDLYKFRDTGDPEFRFVEFYTSPGFQT